MLRKKRYAKVQDLESSVKFLAVLILLQALLIAHREPQLVMYEMEVIITFLSYVARNEINYSVSKLGFWVVSTKEEDGVFLSCPKLRSHIQPHIRCG